MKNGKPSGSTKKKKILIVDDHPLLRVGIARVIDQQKDMTVCGEAEDGPGGLAAVAKCKPDAVIVDISLEFGTGLDLIRDVRAHHPETAVLALSVHHENLYAERAIRAGAKGYVMKREPVDNVLAALRKVLQGHMAVSENVIGRIVAQGGSGKTTDKTGGGSIQVEALSNRELEVFRLLGTGLGTREIASRLGVAISTVETYRAGIKRKLGLANNSEVLCQAARFVANEPID
jgi:DNA-binding NarL/FixJ family response regulator